MFIYIAHVKKDYSFFFLGKFQPGRPGQNYMFLFLPQKQYFKGVE